MKKLSLLFVVTFIHVSLVAQEKDILRADSVIQDKTVKSSAGFPLNGRQYALKALVGTPMSKDIHNLPLDQFGVVQESFVNSGNLPMIIGNNEDPLFTSFWLAYGKGGSESLALKIPIFEPLPNVVLSKWNTL